MIASSMRAWDERLNRRRLTLGVVAVLGLAASMLGQALPAQAAVPVAVDDHYSVLAGASLEPAPPGVLANDLGLGGALYTTFISSDPLHGGAIVTGSGLFRPDPGAGFFGADSFDYCIVKQVAPDVCVTSDATVSIDVLAPRPRRDRYSTAADTPLTAATPGVLANDVDVVAPMAPLFGAAVHGVITPGDDGGFDYMPSPGFRGIDTASYCVVAGPGDVTCLSDTVDVMIEVGLDGFVATGDRYDLDLGATLIVPASTGPLANDQGVSPSDSFAILDGPLHGAVTAIGAGGGFTYTSTDDEAVDDSFTYCITEVPATMPCLSGRARVRVDVRPVVLRVGGADRFALSAAISARTFAPGVAVAYVASGAVYADALSGSAAAGVQHGPLLLVTHDAVPPAIVDELRRVKPARIVVLGGTKSVGEVVENALRPLASSVVRYGGVDRYAVSAVVSRETFATGVPVAYVASGENFPDALSGSAVAGHRGGPVLLVTRASVPEDVSSELARLKPDRIVVLGGQDSVSAGVMEALGDVAPTSRIGGADRFAVSAAVAGDTFPTGARTVYVASGVVFPDALTGSSAAVAHIAPVLLVTADTIPPAVATELDRLDPSRIVVLGGPKTVSEGVSAALRGYLAG
jgi:putative cell wall-binding protein